MTQGIEEMGAFEPDTVIALGGGSAIDTAKAVCHLYAAMKQEKRPYLAAVPTTSGTGSEVTSFAVISDPPGTGQISPEGSCHGAECGFSGS